MTNWIVTILECSFVNVGTWSGYVSTGFFGGKLHFKLVIIPFVFYMLFYKLGLTLSRVVMVEVIKKVIVSNTSLPI